MQMHKAASVLAVFALMVGATAFSAYMLVTTLPVARSNAFYTTNLAFDSTTGAQVGCSARFYLAADSVRIGQVVYLSAKNTVNASATLALYNTLAGIVVGGTRTNMNASYVKADTSTLAATSGQRAIVCTQGRVWALIDTVTDGIGPGVQVIPSLVKGRIKARSTAIDSYHRVIGKMVDTGIRNSAALVQINIK